MKTPEILHSGAQDVAANERRSWTGFDSFSMCRIVCVQPQDNVVSHAHQVIQVATAIAAVLRLARRASVATTARYDRRGEVANRKAARLMQLPYHARQRIKEEERKR